MSNEPAADGPDPELEEAIRIGHEMLDMARAGRPELLAYVDAGAPVNLTGPTGDTLVMLASYHGHADLVRGLVARGADVNRLNDRGQSPLAGAVFKGADEVVAVLLAGGADPDAGTPSAREAAVMFGRALPE